MTPSGLVESVVQRRLTMIDRLVGAAESRRGITGEARCLIRLLPKQRDGPAIMQMRIQDDGAQGAAKVRGAGGQSPKKSKGLEPRPLAELQAQVGALGHLGAVGQQAAHGHEGDSVLGVREEREVHTGLADQAVGIVAEVPQQPGQGEQGGHPACTLAHQRRAGRRTTGLVIDWSHELVRWFESEIGFCQRRALGGRRRGEPQCGRGRVLALASRANSA